MEIKVFGPGCAKCTETENLIKEVVTDKGGDITVRKVTSRHLNSSLARFPFCALPPEKKQLFTDGIVMGVSGPTLVPCNT